MLSLLKDLQARFGQPSQFINDDLAVVRKTSDDVTVLKSGKIMEIATSENYFTKPQAAYSRKL